MGWEKHCNLQLSIGVAPLAELAVGSVVTGVVVGRDPVTGLAVKLPGGRVGHVALTDLADTFTADPLAVSSVK